MKNFIAFIFFAAAGYFSAAPQMLQSSLTEMETSHGALVLWAQEHLPQKGDLKEGSDGYVYLKVDDNYINQLFPMLNEPEYIKPPFFRRPDSPGAHISVFYVDERRRTGPIAEIGKTYNFKISTFSFVPPKTKEYAVLEVLSPELEQLRMKYNLSPLLKNHEFHITIGKRLARKHQTYTHSY